MLQISELTYRIAGRTILENASATIPSGHKVGLVGRNGAGKTTLLKLILGELQAESGRIEWPKTARLGHVAQEAPGGETTLIDWVVGADTERAALLSEAETASDPARIADIQTRLADIDAYSAPSRAARLLAGLGFDDAAQKQPCSAFSGGWRMRVALAGVLLTEPEILLLDEPTNYLDLEGVLWLTSYLKTYPHTVVIVSHDRELLNSAVGSILHLSEGGLRLYSGSFDTFEETLREKNRLQTRLADKQDQERARLQAFVDRFKAKATKAKQAQARVKAIARMKPIALAAEERVAEFSFPAPEKPVASPIVSLDRVSVGYASARPVLSNLSLRIDREDRIALLGANGNGKSTLAKLLSGRLEPMDGGRVLAPKLKTAFFAQHQLDELSPEMTPYQEIARRMPEAGEASRRAKLGAFGFGKEKADTKTANLSGGEKARLLLALASFDGPHLMILDEPTNHLDIDSRNSLIQALNAFEGAVILVSHDRHLIEACADRLWIVRGGGVSAFQGDLDDYQRELLRERSGMGARDVAIATAGAGASAGSGEAEAPRSPEVAETGANRGEQRRQAAALRAELAPYRRRVKDAEQRVEAISRDIAKLDAVLAEADIYTEDPQRAQKAGVDRGRLADALAAAEEAWMEAAAELEAAEAVALQA